MIYLIVAIIMWKFIPVFPTLNWLRNKQDFEAGLGCGKRGNETTTGKYIDLG